MSDMHLLEQTYPPGWDCKFDTRTGKCYYINYLTKAMQLEDPRIRYRQLQNEHASTESIPYCSQPLHGSPYHVYPINNHPQAVQAFQAPNTASLYNVSTSPLLTNRSQKLEMSPVMRMGSPNISRIIHLDKQCTYQETSFTTQQVDTEASVSKINNMFPTASDTHIRLLLKKYYNREAVVISALQVEKHPLTTPGPFSTPPLPRHPLGKKPSLITMTPPLARFEAHHASRTASPLPPRPASSCTSGFSGSPRVGEGYRSSPKPHSSPKMKLRYLKSIYPKAEEMLLLDILANADNNVQKASEKLTSMGYEKKDTTVIRAHSRNREEQMKKERIEAALTPVPQPRLKSTEEKQKIKSQLKAKYKDVAGRIITMALDSVDYSEEKACKILEIVMQDDKATAKAEHTHEIKGDGNVDNEAIPNEATDSGTDQIDRNDRSITKTPCSRSESTTTSAIAKDETKSTILAHDDDNNADESAPCNAELRAKSVASPTTAYITANAKFGSRFKAKSDHSKSFDESMPMKLTSFERSDTASSSKYSLKTSPWNYGRSLSNGPNPGVRRGANEDLLLADYIAWNGANSELCRGNRSLAKGSDLSLRTSRLAIAQGSKSELCKGPQGGLAKGSIFSQLKMQQLANVKCN